jgi:methyltransferase (TIGR00027 family)
MEDGKPSRTAFAAAGYRATHQLFDKPVVLRDPHAIAILGAEAAKVSDDERVSQYVQASAPMRAQIVARSLFAEETLGHAVEGGVRQYVLLGAGLDTFAYRNPWPDVRVFEVDYPATGEWKRERLASAGIVAPPNVAYAGLDFEHEPLAAGLERAGFDLGKPAVFAWLGVTVYLTREAIEATLRSVAALAEGTEIVFDYGEPREQLPEMLQAKIQARMAMLAAAGEPWVSFFAPADMRALLAGAGFSEVEDLTGLDMNSRWFKDRTDGLAAWPLAHVVRARV